MAGPVLVGLYMPLAHILEYIVAQCVHRISVHIAAYNAFPAAGSTCMDIAGTKDAGLTRKRQHTLPELVFIAEVGNLA